jgi:arginine exporter protein ArgO
MKFLDRLASSASKTLDRIDAKTPSEKARFITTAAVLTLINPTLPLLYAGVYGAARLSQDTQTK